VKVRPRRGALCRLLYDRTAPTHTQPLSKPATPLVLGMRVDPIELDDSVEIIDRWLAQLDPPRGRMVCSANVHMVMEAWDDAGYCAAVNRADLVLPDGQPMVWALRLLGVPQRRRVRVSPDLLLRLFAEAERRGSSVGLYGGSDETLPVFKALLGERFPRLRVGFAYAPPFRPLTTEEDEEVVARIRSAGVQLLLVGLGCPKQERWMADHRGRGALDESPLRVKAVMIGVGAAFDFHAGTVQRAPGWMREHGLEWLHRLGSEPGRLWKRYLVTNTLFILGAARQLLTGRG
jgi:N-acetylglucosaminyldiphosphoundecaprenol N-acetyl-beta-D-mannosaminyltransferase